MECYSCVTNTLAYLWFSHIVLLCRVECYSCVTNTLAYLWFSHVNIVLLCRMECYSCVTNTLAYLWFSHVNIVLLCRMECYSCVTNTLAYLWSASISHPQVSSVPKKSGPPPAPDPTRISAAEAEKYVNNISNHLSHLYVCL